MMFLLYHNQNPFARGIILAFSVLTIDRADTETLSALLEASIKALLALLLADVLSLDPKILDRLTVATVLGSCTDADPIRAFFAYRIVLIFAFAFVFFAKTLDKLSKLCYNTERLRE